MIDLDRIGCNNSRFFTFTDFRPKNFLFWGLEYAKFEIFPAIFLKSIIEPTFQITRLYPEKQKRFEVFHFQNPEIWPIEVWYIKIFFGRYCSHLKMNWNI